METKKFFFDTTMLDLIGNFIGLQIVCWRDEKTYIWPPDNTVEGILHQGGKMRELLESLCDSESKPFIYYESDFVFWGVFSFDETYVCLGPITHQKLSEPLKKSYIAEHELKKGVSFTQMSVGKLCEVLLIAFYHYTGIRYHRTDILVKNRKMDVSDIIPEADIEQYQLIQSENDREHFDGREFEILMLDCVKRGDTEMVKEMLSGRMPEMSKTGVVAEKNQKQTEYLTISLITLLTRAAIEGGLPAEEAYELGDIFMQLVEQHRDNDGEYSMIGIRAIYEFADQVRKRKESKRGASYIEDCKDYIARNLRKDIIISDIAPQIGISRTYLSSRFKSSEGITIQQYIQKERCEHAANLLKYSDYSISLIAEYFKFSTQSYFCVCFKEWMGMTPKEYRNRYYRENRNISIHH